MRRVLVTGGAGFVGANLVPVLRRDGYSVRIFDNCSTGDPRYLGDTKAELVKGDIRDADAIDAAMSGIHAVVHLAAAGSVVASVADPLLNFEVNVVGTFRVLDAARRAGVERVILASTGGALVGNAEPPVDERSLPKPISPYGASKLAGEGYAQAFAMSYGMRTACLRFANVYGPFSDKKRGAVTSFFRTLHAGEPIVVYGDGTASRDYIYVADVCRALRSALRADLPGGTVLHLASGVETSVRDLAELCAKVAGRPDHPIEFRPKRPGEVERNFATYGLAQEMIGFTPLVAREEGLRRTWDWFQEAVFQPGRGGGAA